MFRKQNLYILHYTKVLDPTQEKLDISVSLPDNATKEAIKAMFDKMMYVADMRVEHINKLVEAEKQKVAETIQGETQKNKDNRDALKGAASKLN